MVNGAEDVRPVARDGREERERRRHRAGRSAARRSRSPASSCSPRGPRRRPNRRRNPQRRLRACRSRRGSPRACSAAARDCSSRRHGTLRRGRPCARACESAGRSLLAMLAAAASSAATSPTSRTAASSATWTRAWKSCPEGFRCDTSTQSCCARIGRRRRRQARHRRRCRQARRDGRHGPTLPRLRGRRDCTPTAPARAIRSARPVAAAGEMLGEHAGRVLTCNPPRAPVPEERSMMQQCDQAPEQPTQTDHCGPGLVCLEDSAAAVVRALLPVLPQRRGLHRTRLHARRRRAMRRAEGLRRSVHGPAFRSGNGNTGCSGRGAIACYLSSTNPTTAICDCPFNAWLERDGPLHAHARVPRGLVCVDRGRTGASQLLCRSAG